MRAKASQCCALFTTCGTIAVLVLTLSSPASAGKLPLSQLGQAAGCRALVVHTPAGGKAVCEAGTAHRAARR